MLHYEPKFPMLCCAKSFQLCLTLCNPMDCSSLGSSVHEISQAKILEWVAMPSSRGPFWPRAWTHFPCISCTAHRFFTSEPPGNLCKICVLVTQSCPTLCDPIHYSPPGSSVYGDFQARILEWVAISFSRRSSQPRDRTQVSHIVGRRFTIGATREAPNGMAMEE